MDTQLVRLDKPYNVICGNNGKIALHIATLIVITEEKKRDEKGKIVGMEPRTRCYPVVGGYYKMDGEVWMSDEQKDCFVICREKDYVSPYTLKRLMEFCEKTKVTFFTSKMPHFFSSAMLDFGCKIVLPKIDNGKTQSDYEVCLVFEEGNNGYTCMVYSDKDSEFYFNEFFSNYPELIPALPTNLESVKHIAELRDKYLSIFHYEGMRNIKFITKNKDYQWFVDKVNDCKTDGEGI